MPFKAKNNREAVVVCAIHVVKRPSKRSVLVRINWASTVDFWKYEHHGTVEIYSHYPEFRFNHVRAKERLLYALSGIAN